MLNKKNPFWYLGITVVLCGLLVFVGCDSKSTSDSSTGGSTSGTTVSVSTSPASITQNTTSIVEATVISNSAGVPGQIVTFAVTPATAGYFTPAFDTTDANGVAASVFTGTSIGTATVSCTAGGSTIGSSVMSVVSSTQTGGDGNVDISTSDATLFADGADTSMITVTLRDGSGNPAPDSTLVKLVAGEKFVDLDGNGYWTNGVDSIVSDANGNGLWDALGIIQSSAFTTGGTGVVTVPYISGNEATSVYVKASVDDNGITGSVDVQIQLTPNATISSIYMASDSMSLVIKGTGGIETATLTATGYDHQGNPVPEGLPIVFRIIDNPSNPLYPGQDSAHLANVLPTETYTAYTNSQGIASCPISSGHYSGTVRIRATAGSVLSEATQVLIASGPPTTIFVGVDVGGDCNVPYWNTVNERVPVVAVVHDYMHNPVNDSAVVYFTTDESSVMSHIARTEGGEGVAASEWISGENDQAVADGIVWIIAETAGGTVKDSTWFYNTSLTDSVSLESGNPVSLLADGATKTTVTYFGWDVNGNPVHDGTDYEMNASILSVSDGQFEGACGLAWANIELSSAVLKADYSTTGGNDDGIGATDYVTLWSFGGAATYTVTLTTGTAYKKSCAINADASSIPLGSSTYIDAYIADRFGNPLGDHTLNMTAGTGTVTGGTQNTNMYGEAYGFQWTAPSDSASIGDHVISIQDTDPRGNNVILNVTITVE